MGGSCVSKHVVECMSEYVFNQCNCKSTLETFAPGLRVLPYVLIFNDQEKFGVLLYITIL